jgi:hypothetical protein
MERRRQPSEGIRVRAEGDYVLPPLEQRSDGGPRTDWIDYRASIARTQRREQAGDEPLTCPGCGTETDVSDVVHAPTCKHIATSSGPASAPAGLDLLEQMDRGERIARPAAIEEGDVMPEFVCKVDGCENEAPRRGRYAGYCAEHRARTGSPRNGARKPQPAQRRAKATARATANGNGSHASKAERLLAAARAVDDIEAQLARARAELKEAAAALA